ncbi:MAG TPA: DinB family protein [Fibrobacteria bacterium]|nr:DinB family protein [Fibrobacteria bacterium]
MTQADALEEFQTAKDALLSLLEPLDEERLNRVPFPGSWTAGQLGDHLLKSYGLGELLKGRTAPTQRPVDEKREAIDLVFLDFQLQLKSPEFIVPSEGRISKAALLEGLRAKADGILEYARDKDLSFTCLDFVLPSFGTLTGTEWVHFIATHTRRHVRQLERIVAELP